ncbi:hypothetical protein B0H11DRAFT_2384649 [Mycena galericulata]|nr:hypothetical protein B0H11DRAFT_2384649 [Mycena galericulata]
MVYNPKGFTEDDTMLGLTGIVHRAKGLPGLSTLRKHAVIRPLRASPGMPTVQEIEDNIDAFAEAEPVSTGVPVIVHRILMMDEIAVEQRPRWDDKTNMILGVCRECSYKVSLELNTADDLEVFFNALDDGEIHLACEATVAAFGALSKDPRVYSPRPCCISGTDKHEKGPEQARFIQQIMTAGNHKRIRGNITYRTISIASDGEAKRGAALVQKTMNRDLDSDSPIHKLLSPLDLMNFRVGEDDLTADKDYRHVLKTLRNLLMRLKGVKVLGFVIMPAIIKQHLRAAGHSQEQVDAFLNPNDKQDVYLGYQLLKAMWSLPVAPADSSPGFIRTREALRMFGQLGYHLLMPYIFIDLSLHQQLVHLRRNLVYGKSAFGNLMIMIKNVFFCIAKTKIDIPDAEFFIILLGTDRLEVLFGLIRTAIGTDVNVDMYQLSTRASNLTEATIILANRPHWDRSPRRLKLPMIINEAGDISRNADHITPAAWKGDVRVQNINLWTAWKQGRQIAEELVPQGRAILTVCSSTPGVNIFSPLGTSLINYLDEDVSEDFDIDPSLLSAPHADTPADTVDSLPLVPLSADSNSTEDSSYTPDGDVEDALAIAEPQGKFSPHVEINGKLISKARALSGMMRYRGSRASTDRLKRVAGLPSFNPSMEGTGMISDSSLGAASLRVGNPVAVVVSCEEQLFLAVAQVNNIKLASSPVQSIALDSSAKISESEDQLPDDTENTSTSYSTPNSVFAVLQDDEDDFGDELPPAPSPAPVPTDDDEYLEEFPEAMAAQMDDRDDEIPPSEFPPGSADFVATQPLKPLRRIPSSDKIFIRFWFKRKPKRTALSKQSCCNRCFQVSFVSDTFDFHAIMESYSKSQLISSPQPRQTTRATSTNPIHGSFSKSDLRSPTVRTVFLAFPLASCMASALTACLDPVRRPDLTSKPTGRP